jgi:hypothetical protein
MDFVDAFVGASNFSTPTGGMEACWCARIKEAVLGFLSRQEEYLVHNMHLCYYVTMVEHESGFGSELYFRIADISFISIPRQAAV